MNDNSDLPILTQNVDKSQVPPIEQKRMVAFINHFIVNTVSFLNEFLTNVESKFVEFDSKLQTIEASLQIVEAKMASIPDIGSPSKQTTDTQIEIPAPTNIVQNESPTSSSSLPSSNVDENEKMPQTDSTIMVSESKQTDDRDELDQSNGVKACDDVNYRKYFKMLQFGVPAPAVKLKMTAEGFNPDVLDDPNRILDDGIKYEVAEDV